MFSVAIENTPIILNIEIVGVSQTTLRCNQRPSISRLTLLIPFKKIFSLRTIEDFHFVEINIIYRLLHQEISTRIFCVFGRRFFVRVDIRVLCTWLERSCFFTNVQMASVLICLLNSMCARTLVK